MVSQKNPSIDSPKKNDIYKVGTLCKISIQDRLDDGSLIIKVDGQERVSLTKINDNNPKILTSEFKLLPTTKHLSQNHYETAIELIGDGAEKLLNLEFVSDNLLKK